LRDADQQFFDSFMLVLGILIGVAVALFFLVRMIAIDTQGQYVLEDPDVIAEIDARIAPVGQVALAGSEELEAMQAAAQSVQVATPERQDMPMTGAQVYNDACYLCHAAPGVGGAPVIGDGAVWADRLAQGMDVLNDHAINGYQGSAGFMPAKGGRVDLSDAEVIAAVEYMIEQLGQ
jgi:cytochrome c5